MPLHRLVLEEFRNFFSCEVELPPSGVTLITGDNGQGKTNLLEAVSVCAIQRSFRGADVATMVRTGAERARLLAGIMGPDSEHRVDLAILLQRGGGMEVSRNGNKVRRRRDIECGLAGVHFSPDDMELVKGSPGARRRFLDETLTTTPQGAEARGNFDKALRQRNRLLKQIGGRLSSDSALALDIWDERLGIAGDALAREREDLLRRISPFVADCHDDLNGGGDTVVFTYRRSWQGPLEEALHAVRAVDLATSVSSVGPQRDELEITLAGCPARSYGSQGEQRCLTLALRLGTYRALIDGALPGYAQAPSAPVLLLDDVFSELDPWRAEALASNMPVGQVMVSAATEVPKALGCALVLTVVTGKIR